MFDPVLDPGYYINICIQCSIQYIYFEYIYVEIYINIHKEYEQKEVGIWTLGYLMVSYPCLIPEVRNYTVIKFFTNYFTYSSVYLLVSNS